MGTMHHLPPRLNLRFREGAIPCLLGLLALGLLFAAIPSLSRKLRKVDAEGHPLVMEIRDPVAVNWFAPDGKALLFWSRERDGDFRFWNRPGFTPDTKVETLPVTRIQRIEWEQHLEARRAGEERRMQLAEGPEGGMMTPSAAATLRNGNRLQTSEPRKATVAPPIESPS